MARYMVERNYVQILGRIWMPPVVAAMERQLSSYDVENIGKFTRENVREWLIRNAGDFQEILDFRATVGDQWIEWEHEHSGTDYMGCMDAVE